LLAEIEVPAKEFIGQFVCHRLSMKPNLPLHNMCTCTLINYEYTVNWNWSAVLLYVCVHIGTCTQPLPLCTYICPVCLPVFFTYPRICPIVSKVMQVLEQRHFMFTLATCMGKIFWLHILY